MVRKVLAATVLLACCARGPRELDVAAAISLKEALTEVARGWEAQGGERVVFNFAGSNVLARQIKAGAPVDVFLSADERTMASIRGELEAPVPLLGNTLVVMSNRPMTSLRDLAPLKVAIGDPSAVPAGVYAQKALQRAGVRPTIIPCENVRAALAAVESGAADAAIVYATDVRLAKRTKVALALDEQVLYPIAVVKGAKHADAARRFVDYCRSDAAMRIFTAKGFRSRSRRLDGRMGAVPAPAGGGETPPARPAWTPAATRFIAKGFRPAFSRSADTTSTPPARSRS